jgi:Putative zinc-finger
MHVNQHWTDRLSEYHDGELSPADRAACEAHLAECLDCRGLLGELESVIAAARADRSRQPDADLWPGILARLDRPTAPGARVRPFSDPAAVRKTPSQVSFSLPQLALAASLLIAVSAGVSYLAATRTTNRSDLLERPIQAMAESTMPPSAEVTPANFADAQFDQAVADLEQILVEQRDTLDPRTVVIIERNLTVIDEAIRQARAALDADPANPYLNSHLADARRRKLELLRRATTLSGAGD